MNFQNTTYFLKKDLYFIILAFSGIKTNTLQILHIVLQMGTLSLICAFLLFRPVNGGLPFAFPL